MQNQALGERRIATKEQLKRELTAWAENQNKAQKGVNWQFTTKDARTKLLRLYPKIELANRSSR